MLLEYALPREYFAEDTLLPERVMLVAERWCSLLLFGALVSPLPLLNLATLWAWAWYLESSGYSRLAALEDKTQGVLMMLTCLAEGPLLFFVIARVRALAAVLLALGSVYVWPPLGAVTGLALFSAYFESRALEHALLGATLLLYLLRFFVPAERAQAPMFLLWVLEGASLAWVATL